MEIIARFLGKIKSFLASYQTELFITLIILLTGLASFSLGRLSATEGKGSPVRIIRSQEAKAEEKPVEKEEVQPLNTENAASVFASRNGTRYYFSHCSGLKRILEKNKILFASEEEAKARGLTLAANCSGR